MASSDDAAFYEIRIKGHLGPNTLVWFEDFAVECTADGATTLLGPIVDQAALGGILTRICDLGLSLTSFREVTVDELQDQEG